MIVVVNTPHLIFDFDGTLADSLDLVVEITNGLAPEFGYSSSSPEELHQLRNNSTEDILKKVGVTWYKLPFLMLRLRREMNQVIHKLNLVEGMAEVLEELKAQGYTLGIVTSNGRENVKTFLRNHRLDYQFEFIESEFNLWGKSRGIKRLIKKRGWPLEEVAYVGDEVRDIQAAHQIGIKAIAVGWGFQLPEILSEYQPDFLLSEPRELLEVVQKLKNP